MRSLTHFIFVVSTFVSTSVYADKSYLGRAPERGVLVIVNPDKSAVRTGEVVDFKGVIKVVGKSKLEELIDKLKGAHGKKENLLQEFQREGLDIQASFPSAAVDVSSKLVLTGVSDSEIQFSYKSSPIKTTDLNQFSLKVFNNVKDKQLLKSLVSIQAKLEKRIQVLQELLKKCQNNKALKEVIAVFQKEIDKLSAVVARIQDRINSDENVLASHQYALQVDNLLAQASSVSTVMSQFRFAIDAVPGNAMEGMRTQFSSKIIYLSKNFSDNLSLKNQSESFSSSYHDEDIDDLDDGEYYLAEFIFNGQKLSSQKIIGSPSKVQVAFTHLTNRLIAQNSNQFDISLYKVDRRERKKKIGYMNYVLPTQPDTVAPVLTLINPGPSEIYLKNLSHIEISAADAVGIIDEQSFTSSLQGKTLDNQDYTVDLKGLLTSTRVGDGERIVWKGSLQTLPEGEYKITANVADPKGNQAPTLTHNFSIDRTSPLVSSPYPGGLAIASYSVDIPVKVEDVSPTFTDIIVNDELFFSTGAKDFNASIGLNKEGLNKIKFVSVDAAGNASIAKELTVFRDTTPPQLTFVMPQNLDYVDGVRFNIEVQSDEFLGSSAFINTTELEIPENSKSIKTSYTLDKEGEVELTVRAQDLLGNQSEKTIKVTSLLRALVPSLVGLYLDEQRNVMIVKGAVGVTRPGLNVKVSGGFFNSKKITASAQGSFEVELDPESSYEVSVYDPVVDKDFSTRISYGVDQPYILAGTIKDIYNNPIVNAKVNVLGSNLVTYTNDNGVFEFKKVDYPNISLVGDQTLSIDGSTVIQANLGDKKKYSRVSLPISVGLKQNNVLQTPIYLTPVFLDESSTEISKASGGVVMDPHAPDVVLEIPANSVQFPSGQSQEKISLVEIPADRVSIPVPGSSAPETVVSLEPSGTKFTEPVKIELPNSSSFSAGTEMLLVLYNSATGRWEIGGSAQVSADGNKVVSKPGQGLRHFSLVYATPMGPEITKVGAQDKPGANTLDGAVSTSIALPGFKIYGNDVNLGLTYKSTWAKPSLEVTNIFNFPDRKINVDYLATSGSGSSTGAQRIDECKTIIGTWKTCVRGTLNYYSKYFYDIAYRNLELNVKPTKIETQLFTQDLVTEPYIFSDNKQTPENEIKPLSMVSFMAPLKDKNGDYFKSGLYPYFVDYKVSFDGIVLSGSKSGTFYQENNTEFKGVKSVSYDTKIINFSAVDEIIGLGSQNQVLANHYIVQNKIDSVGGRGWKINGTQKILNPQSSKIVIEESNGELSTYSVASTMQTVFSGDSQEVSLNDGIALEQYPLIIAKDKNSNKVVKLDLSGSSAYKTDFSSFSSLSGNLHGHDFFAFSNTRGIKEEIKYFYGKRCEWRTRTVTDYYCSQHNQSYSFDARPKQMVFNGSEVIGIDNFRHNIFSSVMGATELNLFGSKTSVPNFSHNYNTNSVTHSTEMYNFCNSQGGIKCGALQGKEEISYSGYGCGHAPTFYYCSLDDYSGLNPGNNLIPQRGTIVNGVLTLNSPEAIVASNNPNEFIIADTGNYLVRIYNRQNSTIRTVAGKINQNNPTSDTGDGELAVEASISRPLAVMQDSAGNIYFTTEGGRVRKVDNAGIISSIAGFGDPELSISGLSANLSLLRPSGIVLDEPRQIMYVADTGHNRVVSIDLQSGEYTSVAGTGDSSSQDKTVLALEGAIYAPTLMKFDSDGNIIVVESGANKLKKLSLNYSRQGSLTFLPSVKDNTRLVRESDGSWVRTYRSGDKSYFDTDGYHLKDESLIGRVVRYEYENFTTGSGNLEKRLTRILMPNSQVVQYNYSGRLLSSITDPAGRQTSFYYTFSDDLKRVEFPDGTKREFEYAFSGLLVKEKDAKNSETQYVYNARERLLKVINANQSAVQIGDAASNIVNKNESGSMPTAFDSANTIVDANGNSTKVEKDFMGYIYTITDAKGQVTTLRRDEEGRVTEVIAPDGSHTKNTYDQVTGDLLVTESVDLGIREEKAYNQFGQIVAQKNGNGFVFTKQYNAQGQLIKETAPDGSFVSYAYNAQGLLAEKSMSVNGQILTSSYEYNNLGQLVKTTDSSGKFVEYQPDLAGNTLRSKSGESLTNYEYDHFNRLLKVTSPKLEITQYQYSVTGELTKIIDPKNNETNFSYNNLGQLVQKVDMNGKVHSFAYDANGNTVQETDPNGNIKVFAYDSLNQLIKAQLPDDVIQYQYNTKGEVSSQSNLVSQISYQRDTKGRVTQVGFVGAGELSNFVSYNLNQDFDFNGNRIRLRTEYGHLNYVYDSLNRLTTLVGFGGEQFGFNYDSGSRLTRINRPGGSTEFDYNTNGTVQKISHIGAGSVKSYHEYTYNDRNFPVQKRSIAGDLSYAYDPNGQLSSASSVSTNEAYSYDPLGNRITDQNGLYVYDDKSQLLKEDYQYLYNYDNNGNLISKIPKDSNKNAWAYHYSSKNQLMKVQQMDRPLGQVIRQVDYRYDVLGRRIQKSVWTKDAESDPKKTYVRKYIYDGDNIFAEFDGNNVLIARYTHSPLGPDDILESEITNAGVTAGLAQNDGKYFYLKDALGSVSDIVDGSGQIVQRYDYESFGKIRSITSVGGGDITSSPIVNTSFTYTGREWDEEAGLYYYRARYYDANVGRFIQKDPHPGEISRPLTSNNSYIYALNNPNVYRDPDGRLAWFIAIPLISALAGAISSGLYAAIQGQNVGKAMLSGFISGGVAGLGAVAGIGAASLFLGVTGGSLIGTMTGMIAGSIGGGLAGAGFAIASGGSRDDIILGALGGALTGLIAGAVVMPFTADLATGVKVSPPPLPANSPQPPIVSPPVPHQPPPNQPPLPIGGKG